MYNVKAERAGLGEKWYRHSQVGHLHTLRLPRLPPQRGHRQRSFTISRSRKLEKDNLVAFSNNINNKTDIQAFQYHIDERTSRKPDTQQMNIEDCVGPSVARSTDVTGRTRAQLREVKTLSNHITSTMTIQQPTCHPPLTTPHSTTH